MTKKMIFSLKFVFILAIIFILLGSGLLHIQNGATKVSYPLKLVKVSRPTYKFDTTIPYFSPNGFEWTYDSDNKRIFLEYGGIINVLDVRTPEEPTLILTFDPSLLVGFDFPIGSLTFHQGFLYIAHPKNRFLIETPRILILDVRDLEDIRLATFDTSWQFRGCNSFYFPSQKPDVMVTTGYFQLSFWDISNKSSLKLLWTKSLWSFRPEPHVELPRALELFFHPTSPLLLIYVANLEYYVNIPDIYMLDFHNCSDVHLVSYSAPPGAALYSHEIYKFELFDNGFFPVILWSDGIVVIDWHDPFSPKLHKMFNNTLYHQNWHQKIFLHKQSDKIILYDDLTTIFSLSDQSSSAFLSKPLPKPDGLFSNRRPLTDRIMGNDYIFCLTAEKIPWVNTTEPITTWKIVESEENPLTDQELAAIVATTGGILLIGGGVVGGFVINKKRKAKLLAE